MSTQQNLRYLDIRPKLVPAERESVIEIRPRFDGGRFPAGREFTLSHVMMEDTRCTANVPVAWKKTVRVDADGVLRVRAFFEGEQEHVLRGITFANSGGEIPVEAHLYSVQADLYTRKAWKGDLHLHSCRSDGLEPPAYVAASSRRIGLDFMAVTDHHQYAPSLEAIAAFADVPHDLRIYPGEELHPNAVHIVNFGGRFGVDELLEREESKREIEEMRRALPPVPRGVDPAWAAQMHWAFDKVREAGGLAVFCHPYWTFHAHYSLAEAYIDYIFATQPFDAFELIGGFMRYETESNLLQIARYHEERARGRQLPIVGASDSHGCERGDLFGWYYTLVFSPSTELAALIANIKDGYSVAVDALPGADARAHGPFRLVKYAHFLLREIFPLHDDLCVEEGQCMHRHLCGDPGAEKALAHITGRVSRLYDGLWGSSTAPFTRHSATAE